MMRCKSSRGLLMVVVMASACGPSQPEFAAEDWPILYGEEAPGQEHMPVVVLKIGTTMCSGTLISNQVVMTAGHCLNGKLISTISVGFGTWTDRNAGGDVEWLDPDEVVVHPDYDGGNAFVPPVNDLALLRLADAPPAGIAPIPILPHAIGVTQADLGKPVEFVGWGTREDGSNGVKMTVTENLDWVCIEVGGCPISAIAKASQNTIGQDQTPGGFCTGDSGGPGLIVRNNQRYVAGVMSYNDKPCTAFGIATKVDEFEPFINDYLGVSGELGDACGQDAQCNSNHCVGGVCCDSLCSDLCMSCNQAGALGSCRAVPNGTACADADLCDGAETCQGGVCVPGTALACSDGNPCTDDACIPASGQCTHANNTAACDDGNPCTANDTCAAGACQGGAILCDDANPCTDDACNPSNGACSFTNNSLPCDDGDACTSDDVCTQGICKGITNGQLSCDDHNPCTENDACVGGACTGTPRDCSGLSGICQSGACNPQTGQCELRSVQDGTACDDGDLCTLGETCQGGVCAGGANACDPDDPPSEGCGCGAGGSAGSRLVFLLFGLWIGVLRLRRQRP